MLAKERPSPANEASLELTVRQVLSRLHALDPKLADRLNAVAFVLARVADADEHITEQERAEMEAVVASGSNVSAELAMLLVEIAHHRSSASDCARSYGVSRGLRLETDAEARTRLLHSLFDVATADGRMSRSEEAEIVQIASELGFTRADVTSLLRETGRA